MNHKRKIFRIILLTIFGIWFAYSLHKSSIESFILDVYIFIFIGIVGLLILFWSIFKDSKEFKTSKKLSSFLPSLFGLIFISANIALFFFQENRANAPSLIKGFYDGGFNGFSVDFKTDGNYIMANGSGLGQSFFYGTYTLKDSIITLDKSNRDKVIESNKLAIKSENYFPKDSIDLIASKANYITQINDNGLEIDREFRFRVTVDNRAKLNN